jgi:hypothetical protein
MMAASGGYITGLEDTKQLATDCIPVNDLFKILLLIGRIAVYFKLMISIPTNMNPLILTLYGISEKEGEEFKQRK